MICEDNVQISTADERFRHFRAVEEEMEAVRTRVKAYAALRRGHLLETQRGRSACVGFLIRIGHKLERRSCLTPGMGHYGCNGFCKPGWFDHTRFWRLRGDRRPILITTEPYQNPDEFRPIVDAWAAPRNLVARVSDGGMWNPDPVGGTCLIEIAAVESWDYLEQWHDYDNRPRR